MLRNTHKTLDGEAGYATIMVTGLMAIVSLIVFLCLQDVMTNFKRSERVYRQIEDDLALETAQSLLLGDVVTGNLKFSSNAASGNKTINHQSIRFLIRQDQDRIHLNELSAEDLRTETKNTFPGKSWPVEFIAMLESSRVSEKRVTRDQLSEISALFPIKVQNCIREHFSVYPASKGITQNTRQTSAQKAPDGSYLIVRTQTNSDRAIRWVETSGIVTGRPDDPFWVLDWKRGSGDPQCH